MQLGVCDVARILNVSEKSIYRWIQQGQLPTYKVKDQYRFNRAEIFEWANAQKINVSPEIFSEMDSSVEMMPDFGDALEAGGIFYRLEGIGKELTVADVLREVFADRPFYETSGGGMTVSGGEPMAQFDFTRALVQGAKAAGISVCLETAGVGAWDEYEQLLGAVDLFLYDFKESDPVRHLEFTGYTCERILDNLRRLDEAGAALVLRCPIIPGCNCRDDHFQAIAALANRLRQVREIQLMPYHPLGRSKLKRLGKEIRWPDSGFPGEAEVARWVTLVAAHTRVPVRQG